MNRLYINFNLPYNISDEYAVTRNIIQELMKVWCTERIGLQSFLSWQYDDGHIHIMRSVHGVSNIRIYDGIYIRKDNDHVAFKLTFGI